MKMLSNPISRLFKVAWVYSKENRKQFVFVCVINFIKESLVLTAPIFIAKVFDLIQFERADKELIKKIGIFLLIWVSIHVAYMILHYVGRIVEVKNSFITGKNLRIDLMSKVIDLPASWHASHHSGDIIDKINRASDGIEHFSNNIYHIIRTIVLLFGSIIILFVFNWKYGIITVGVLSLFFFLVIYIDSFISLLQSEVLSLRSRVTASTFDFLSNIRTIIALRLKDKVVHEIVKLSQASFPKFLKFNVLDEKKWFVENVGYNFLIALVVFLGVYFSWKSSGVVAAGFIVILYEYMRNISEAFDLFADNYSVFVFDDAHVSLVNFILEEHKKLDKKQKYLPNKNWQKIEIKNLNFSYIDEEKHKIIFKDVNFEIKRGEKIALIGESGSGKSTLMNLISGSYDVTSVEVFVDGQRIPRNDLNIFHSITTLLPQDPELFNSTIRENITMGIDTNDKNIRDVIRIAHFDKVLAKIEKGLEANIQEKGVNLSGGEKQRLALARGMLASKGSEIILFDEPTSSIDQENEIAIYNDIFLEFKDKTIISSLHKTHLLPMFDTILCFKNGGIIKIK